MSFEGRSGTNRSITAWQMDVSKPQRSAFAHEVTPMGQEYVPRVPSWIVVKELRVLEGVGLLGVAMDQSLALLLRGGPSQRALALCFPPDSALL